MGEFFTSHWTLEFIKNRQQIALMYGAITGRFCPMLFTKELTEMEINITKFFTQNKAPRDYAASVAEIGEDAGATTWQAACDDAQDVIYLDSPEKREAFKGFAKACGCECESENPDALFLQWVAGDCREMGLNTPADFDLIDWPKIEMEQAEGRISSNIFHGVDGEIYFYAGT